MELNSANRLTVVDIGSQDGFLEGGRLIYKANSSNVVPQNTVIVIDNAPYHGEQQDKVPTKSATKKAMIEWLPRHGKVY